MVQRPVQERTVKRGEDFSDPEQAEDDPGRKNQIPDKAGTRAQGQPMFCKENHHKSQGRQIKDRRGFLPERLGEELRRGLKCSHEKAQGAQPTRKGKTPAKCPESL